MKKTYFVPKRYSITLLLMIFFDLIFSSLILADTVYLKDGRVEKGEILEDADDYLVIFDPETSWRKVLYKDLITKVESDKPVDLESWEKQKKAAPKPDYAFADTVYLKDGRVVKGEILEDADDYLLIFDPDSLWKIVLYKDLITKVESDKPIDLESREKLKEEPTDTPKETRDILKEKSG